MFLQSDNGEEEKICRICCLSTEPISCPCKCRGSIKYVHSECLFEWMKERGKFSCEICDYEIMTEKVYKNNTPEHISIFYIIRYVLEGLGKLVIACCEQIYVMMKILCTLCIAGWGGVCIFGHELGSTWWRRVIISCIMLTIGFIQSVFLFVVYKITCSRRILRIDTQRTIERLEAEENIETRNSKCVSCNDNIIDNLNTLKTTTLIDEKSSIIDENINNTSIIDENINNSSIIDENINNSSIIDENINNSSIIDENINNSITIDENINNTSIIDENINNSITIDENINNIYEEIDYNSEDEDINENREMEDTLIYFQSFFLPFHDFKIKKEITQILLLVWFSLFIIIYKKLLLLFLLVFQKINFFNLNFNLPVIKIFNIDLKIFFEFFKKSCISEQLFFVSQNLLFCLMILFFLNVLSCFFKNKATKTVYNFSKVIIFIFCSSCFLFNLTGVLLHAFLCAVTNNKFTQPDWSTTKLSFVFYTAVGLLINFIFKQFIVEFSIRLRPGAIYNSHTENHNYFNVFKIIIFQSYLKYIGLCLYNLFLMLLCLFIVVIINSKYIPLENIYSACTIRLFFFLCTICKEFVGSLVDLLLCLSKKIIKLLKLTNYFFNESIEIDRLGNIIWDYNKNINHNINSKQLKKVNLILKKSIHENIKNKSYKIDSDILKNSVENNILKNSVKNNILNFKFQISDQNLKRFFAKKHNFKYSLFYKPNFFKIRLFLLIILWFIFLNIIFHIFFYMSFKISNFFNGLSYFNIPLFLLFIKLFSIIVKSYFDKNVFIGFIKSLIIYFYSDFIIPTLSSILYIIIFANFDSIFFFSKIWATANLFSFLFHSFLLQFSIYDSISSMNFKYIFKTILFWFIMKLFILLFFYLFKYYANFIILIYIIVMGFLCYGISRLISFLVSKNWLEIIKDHYFIKEKLIKNIED